MTRRSPRPFSQRLSSLYSWHRWLGLAAAIFVLLFAVTGLLLNHSEDLGLDRRGVTGTLWHKLYRLDDRVDIRSLPLGQHWLSHAEGRLYFNDRFIAHTPQPLGAVADNDLWVVASPAELLLLGSQGEVLERIGPERLPGRITAIAAASNGIRLTTAYAAFIGKMDSLNWRVATKTETESAKLKGTDPPVALRETISADIRADRITLERLLLDLHSGQLLGSLGVWLMDGAAIMLIALAISGPWLWLHLRRRLQRRRKRLQQN